MTSKETGMTTKQIQEYASLMITRADVWIAACGGQETPFEKDGTRYLYVYNPARREHGYLNLGTDIVQESI